MIPTSAPETATALRTSKSGISVRNWRRALKDRVVTRGIQAICGKDFDLMPAVAAEIPLASAGARYLWLRMLGAAGCQAIVTRSALGYDFVCHVGDLSEFPYYHRGAHRRELALCAHWLSGLETPVVFDVGANTGFFVTQLAQMTQANAPLFYAFEAIPSTYTKLAASIRRLGLDCAIRPIAAPVLDKAGDVRLECKKRNSLLGRVMAEGETSSSETMSGRSITLDAFCATHTLSPCLLKIDVEGSEPAVLRGAANVIVRTRPAILFEHNPQRGCAETAALLRDGLLRGYRLFYVDDLRGQILPFGRAIDDIAKIDWICNLFAIHEDSSARCAAVFAAASKRLDRDRTPD